MNIKFEIIIDEKTRKILEETKNIFIEIQNTLYQIYLLLKDYSTLHRRD